VSVFRLVVVRGTSIGSALATADAATIARHGADAFLEIASEKAARVVRDLAFAGIAAEPSDKVLEPPRHLAVGIGTALVPLEDDPTAFDLLRLERVPLGAATSEVLRRRLGRIRPPGREARDRCRALLRGERVMFRWGRRVWASREALRSRRVRSSIRPVVFDRSSLDRWPLEGRIWAHDEALSRWVFA
jgi:hypothetical protein